MGSRSGRSPDEIDKEIIEQRQRMSRRLEELQERLQGDVESLRSDTRPKFNLRGAVGGHPLSSITGAFGVGVFLGAVSDRIKVPRRRSRGNGAQVDEVGTNGSKGRGLGIGMFLGAAARPVGQAVEDEVRGMVRQGIASLMNGGHSTSEESDSEAQGRRRTA